MIQPTSAEIKEYEALFNEFKDYKQENPKTHVDTELIKKIITPLPSDDPMRVHGERLARYNKYLMLSTKLAPFFFADYLYQEKNFSV